MSLRDSTSGKSEPGFMPARPRESGARTDRSKVKLHAGRQRGAVLIVALLVSALIAVALASYLRLNLSSTRLAKRSFNGYAAINLADAGAEEAVWAFNRATHGDSNAWTGWSTGGSAAWERITGFDYGANTTGWVKVYVSNTSPPPGTQPKIVTQSTIQSPDDTPVTKMLEVTLRRRSYFANGLVSKDSVNFSGSNTSIDSWNSDPDQDPTTPPIPFSTAVRNDRGSVASTTIANTAVLVNQANIWGYVATGGAQPQVGTGGTVRGADTAAGVAVDPRRISTDFTADFETITAPTDGTTIASVGATLGTLGTATKWRTPSVALAGNDTLTILGDVTLVVTAGSGSQAISVTGNASVIIPDGSSLTVYAEGNLKFAGRGVANANVQPISFQIWGTNTTSSGQDIHIAGNGALKSVCYAPFGDVKINGNGDVMGSVIARTITLTGNAAFHYDESLAFRESNGPFTIAKWRELTTDAERAAWSLVLNF
jgi:Tfp pilus assembly protein PilX